MIEKRIDKRFFGSTGHESTRILFGGAAFFDVAQHDADRTMDLLEEYGINHIDTAASYGKSEMLLGPWLKHNREKVFLATKTEERTYKEAKEELYRSLDLLKTDHVDLWQMHLLIDPAEWQTAMGENGALEAFVEAREKGLVRFLGVTGHGVTAPWMHLKSLERYSFDSVLLPYNFPMMQNRRYREGFDKLSKICMEKSIALQAIKTLAKGPKGNPEDTVFATWYEPLSDPESIKTAVSWALGNEQIFLNSAGDIHLLPHILSSASDFKTKISDEEMKLFAEAQGMTALFQ